MGNAEGEGAGSFLKDLITAIGYLLPSRDPPEPFREAVKLVHADDLQTWRRFKRYEEHESTTYAQYLQEVKRLEQLRKEIRLILEAIDRLMELDHDGPEKYETLRLTVPRSLLRNPVHVPLPQPQHPETVYTAGEGVVGDGVLTVKGRFRTREVTVWMACPSRILHATEIEEKKRWLDERSPEEKEKLHAFQTSRFSQPILFISHRWESSEHPDPEGRQLAKLSALRDCFVIYDYSSFPQDPASAGLQEILKNMERLIEKVIVLKSTDYVERGWCLYEYIVASLKVTLVCDEVRDPDFVQLRQWSSMKAPPSDSIRGHSFESSIQNSIDENILDIVNRILPTYQKSGFSRLADRDVVTDLLIEKLMAALPPKKEYTSPYLGEWVSKRWTREELAKAFTEKLHWERLDTTKIAPHKLDVPSTIQQAVERRYAIERPPRLNLFSALERMIDGGLFR